MIKKGILVLDLDGVLSDGRIYLTDKGKLMKVFSADDHDAIDFARQYLGLVVVSADRNGQKISRRRVEKDLGLDFHLVSSIDRGQWIAKTYDENFKIYMGDGYYDHLVKPYVDYLVAPANANHRVLAVADFITTRVGGDRAVAEALDHILNKFFDVSNSIEGFN